MNIQLPPSYLRSLKFGFWLQGLALLLAGGILDNGFFIGICMAGWVVFWLGVVALTRLRPLPSLPELVLVRYGPLIVFFVVFVVGQYL